MIANSALHNINGAFQIRLHNLCQLFSSLMPMEKHVSPSSKTGPACPWRNAIFRYPRDNVSLVKSKTSTTNVIFIVLSGVRFPVGLQYYCVSVVLNLVVLLFEHGLKPNTWSLLTCSSCKGSLDRPIDPWRDFHVSCCDVRRSLVSVWLHPWTRQWLNRADIRRVRAVALAQYRLHSLVYTEINVVPFNESVSNFVSLR